MTSLCFFLFVIALFSLLFKLETGADATQPTIRQLGLFTWLTSGNWPAKVGAGLLILGIGSLLKYVFVHVDITPEAKLASGFVLSAAIGAAAFALKNNPLRRAIHLALAGTAFGVAYLTAYSAYGFFNYLNDVGALSLLALVSIAAGVFAVQGNAMSIAILAMAGAYVAPAFSLTAAPPLQVYGYYLAISGISFAMVLINAWRPLIHLSFIFTLAGGVFFGWAANYYRPEHYAVMQPLLLALTALHLAMPLVERRSVRSTWQLRFDIGYFICLPLVAVTLTAMIAPDWQLQGANGLAMLAILWGVAASALRLTGQPHPSRYSFVAGLLLTGAILCRLQDVPWALVTLALVAVTLRMAPYLQLSKTAEQVCSGAALLFAFLHGLASLFATTPEQAFLNIVFAERLLAALLLGYVGWIATQRRIDIAKALILTAMGWLVLAVVSELTRVNLDIAAQVIYGLLLAACFALAACHQRMAKTENVTTMLILVTALCSWWTVESSNRTTIIVFLSLTAIALLTLAWTQRKRGDDSAATALALLPIALLAWAHGWADATHAQSLFWIFNAFVAGALLAVAAARLFQLPATHWRTARHIHFYAIAVALAMITLFHIERGAMPVAFELLALFYLALVTWLFNDEQLPVQPGIVLTLGVTLVLQAMLLRVLGPDGVLTILDIAHMKLKAVVSLIWVVLGAGLTWTGVRFSSRHVWSAGAALLVIAAVKLVLFDFNSLGQLGNILALIAAGLVFLCVAWLAPFPPKEIARPPKPWSGTRSTAPTNSVVATPSDSSSVNTTAELQTKS